MSFSKYMAKAVADVEAKLKLEGLKLPINVPTPLSSGYCAECDGSRELNATEQNYYKGVIGVLCWICELGRLDIIVAVSLLSRYLAQGREGHLQKAYNIFGYLKRYGRSKLVVDDKEPWIDESAFTKCDWSEFYPDTEELMPPDMPEPLQEPVMMTCFVNADHADCKETRRSHTGIIIMVN